MIHVKIRRIKDKDEDEDEDFEKRREDTSFQIDSVAPTYWIKIETWKIVGLLLLVVFTLYLLLQGERILASYLREFL